MKLFGAFLNHVDMAGGGGIYKSPYYNISKDTTTKD